MNVYFDQTFNQRADALAKLGAALYHDESSLPLITGAFASEHDLDQGRRD